MIRTLATAVALALLAIPAAAQDTSTQGTTEQGTSTSQDTTSTSTTSTGATPAQDPAMAQGTTSETGGVASASTVNGPVQVNQGEQFLPLQTGQSLRAGDRVMAMQDGSATLTFQDGCTLTVAPETMIVVPSTSTCAGGVATAQAITPGSTDAVGATSYQGETATASGGTGSTYSGVDWAGFGIVAGTVLVGNAVLFSDDDDDDDDEDDDDTVSP